MLQADQVENPDIPKLRSDLPKLTKLKFSLVSLGICAQADQGPAHLVSLGNPGLVSLDVVSTWSAWAPQAWQAWAHRGLGRLGRMLTLSTLLSAPLPRRTGSMSTGAS